MKRKRPAKRKLTVKRKRTVSREIERTPPEIEYSPPSGAPVSDPDMDQLRELILHGDEKYWNNNSGCGTLSATSEDNDESLLLILKEPYGFVLMGLDSESTDHYMSEGSDDYSTRIECYLEGDPWMLPPAYFVSREVAWKVAEEFCRTGRRSDQIKWVLLTDLEF